MTTTQVPEKVKPVLKPLSGKQDHLALEISRYRNHIQQLYELNSLNVGLANEVRGLEQEAAQKRGQMSSYLRTMVHIKAEAQDQVGRLIALGLSQEEISAIISVPDIVDKLDITTVIPPSAKERLGKEEAAPETKTA
jgi:hypothetical protein